MPASLMHEVSARNRGDFVAEVLERTPQSGDSMRVVAFADSDPRVFAPALFAQLTRLERWAAVNGWQKQRPQRPDAQDDRPAITIARRSFLYGLTARAMLIALVPALLCLYSVGPMVNGDVGGAICTAVFVALIGAVLVSYIARRRRVAEFFANRDAA